MKKVVSSLAVLSMISGGVLAEDIVQPQKVSEVFVGVDYFQGESEYSIDVTGVFSGEKDFDQKGYRLKLGVHDKNNIRFQGYLKVEDFDDAFDEKIYGLGADALFTMPVQPNFKPYLLIGFSSDWTELDDPGIDYSEDSINAFTFKGGVGALFRLNQSLELQAGIDFQYRSWQEIQIVGTGVDIEQDDKSQTFYLGLNVFF